MMYLSHLVPQNAYLLRGSLNQIANWSEQGTYTSSLKGRSAALCIPLIAAIHVPLYAIQGVTGSLHHLSNGQFKQGFIKLISGTRDALKSLAFAIASIAWSVSGIFLGSWTLNQLRTEIVRPEDIAIALANLNERMVQTRSSQIAIRQKLMDDIEGRDRDIAAIAIEVDQQFQALTAQNQEAKTQIETLKAQVTELTTGKDAVEAEKNELQTKVGSLEGLLATTKAELQNITSRFEALTQIHQITVEERNALTAQIEGLFQQIRTAQDENVALRAVNNRLQSELEQANADKLVMGGQRDALQAEVVSLRSQKETAESRNRTLSSDLERLQDTHRIVLLDLETQKKENTGLRNSLVKETTRANLLSYQVHALRQENERLGKELGSLKADYKDLLSHLNAFKGRTQEEKISLMKSLEEQGKKIEEHEWAIQELMEKQEELERESLELKGFVLVDDLERSIGVPSPNEHTDVFGTLWTHLVENSKPVYSIENKGNTVQVSHLIVTQLDSFTASSLTFMLLKGYDTYGQKTPAKFKALLASVEKTFAQFKTPQSGVEYLTLKETIEAFKGDKPIDLAPERSVESLLDLIMGKSSETTLRHPFMQPRFVVQALVDRFGKTLVDAAFSYYSLSQDKLLTEKEVAMLVVSIAANLDLESAKQYLKTEDENEIIKAIGHIRQSALDFTKKYTLTPSVLQSKQFLKDTSQLDALVKVGNEDTSTAAAPLNLPKAMAARLACIEYLGRDLVYSLFDPAFSYYNLNGGGTTKFNENMLVAVAGLGNTVRLYQVKTLVREGGVYGVTLVPVKPQPEDEAIVLFRGTFDLASISRDIGFWERDHLEFGIGGPGSRSFNDRCDRIVDKWKEHTEGLGLTKFLGIGHSLGGSDISRFIEALLHKNELSKDVKTVDIVTFNAPHVEKNTYDRFKEGIKRYLNSFFSVTHMEGEGDYVPLAGIKKIAGDVSPGENLTTDTIVFAQEVSARKGPYEAHTSYWLTKGGDPTLSPKTFRGNPIVALLANA